MNTDTYIEIDDSISDEVMRSIISPKHSGMRWSIGLWNEDTQDYQPVIGQRDGKILRRKDGRWSVRCYSILEPTVKEFTDIKLQIVNDDEIIFEDEGTVTEIFESGPFDNYILYGFTVEGIE